jgi:hypothetical protein
MNALEILNHVAIKRWLSAMVAAPSPTVGRRVNGAGPHTAHPLEFYQEVLRMDAVGVAGLPPSTYGWRSEEPLDMAWTCASGQHGERSDGFSPSAVPSRRIVKLGRKSRLSADSNSDGLPKAA